MERLPLDRLARGTEQEVSGRGKAAADHDELGVEDVDEAADRDAEAVTEGREQLDGRGIALLREPHETVRVDGWAEDLLSRDRRRPSRGERLEVAAARAAALAGRPVEVDDHVPELGTRADRAPIRPPATPVPRVSMTMCCVPRPAPWAHSASVAAFASLSIPTGRPKRSRIHV